MRFGNVRKKRVFLFSVFALAMLLAGITAVMLVHKQTPWPSKELVQVQKATDFTVYYPTPLPQGYKYLPGSVRTANGIVIYSLISGTRKVTITTQDKPEGVDFNDFYSRLLTNKLDALNTHGKAVVGTAGGKLIGSLVTDKEWVLMNAPSGVDIQTVNQIVSSLTPVR